MSFLFFCIYSYLLLFSLGQVERKVGQKPGSEMGQNLEQVGPKSGQGGQITRIWTQISFPPSLSLFPSFTLLAYMFPFVIILKLEDSKFP